MVYRNEGGGSYVGQTTSLLSSGPSGSLSDTTSWVAYTIGVGDFDDDGDVRRAARNLDAAPLPQAHAHCAAVES